MARRRIFTVETPVPECRVVTLYEDTWDQHIITGHPEMIGHLGAVEQALVAPTFVCDGNLGDSFQFVNATPEPDILSPTIVVVHGVSTGELIVKTAYKGRKSHTNTTGKNVRWPKP